MGRYLSKARKHAEKIKYFYDHAGERGYSQALYHWNKLSSLALRASRSKRDKNDAPLIQEIKNSLKNMMDEMEERKNIKPNASV